MYALSLISIWYFCHYLSTDWWLNDIHVKPVEVSTLINEMLSLHWIKLNIVSRITQSNSEKRCTYFTSLSTIQSGKFLFFICLSWKVANYEIRLFVYVHVYLYMYTHTGVISLNLTHRYLCRYIINSSSIKLGLFSLRPVKKYYIANIRLTIFLFQFSVK